MIWQQREVSKQVAKCDGCCEGGRPGSSHTGGSLNPDLSASEGTSRSLS